ncbi:ATPase [Adhaeribacter aerolatus]|uniref:ATPase n=1 Tax=Adhaeribacter aerolatus TaxID=670289 RepID=A0A512B2N7_9BACT|nr:cation-translocating P-type ATPase [Adhaeribacter aerolatus]GEO06235.1 ATPase [Adhaeribacter aerolatus]
MKDWHLLTPDDTIAALKTNPNGLTTAEIARRLEQHGYNQMEEQKRKPWWRMVLDQLADFMILVLIVASIISGLLGEWTDTFIILAIVLLNTIMGFVQEYRAEKAMEALKKMTSPASKVIRNGQTVTIPSAELVPGDKVLLEGGDIVPADLRLIITHQLKVDESALTGESHNIDKDVKALPPGEYPLGDRINLAYKGTNITSGRGVGYVTGTGMGTELGNIAKMIQGEDTTTPLQKRLAAFGKRLTIVIIFICIIVFVMGVLRGEAVLVMLMTAISLAVAAIPEALPAVVTISLALGAKRMVIQNALIRKLPAVETLGSVTYICSDKTGTLTINKMTVQAAVAVAVNLPEVPYAKEELLLICMALNNDVTRNEEGNILGESTETALYEYAAAKNFLRPDWEVKLPRYTELPFDSQRKLMTTVHAFQNGYLVITKGATDVLFNKLAPEDEPKIGVWQEAADKLASEGLRVLGYGVKLMDTLPEKITAGQVENDIRFVGFAGLIDPAREEAKDAVAQCRHAGIIPVMITGDHPLTASAIARTIGIIQSEDDLILTGTELAALSQEDFEKIVLKVKVYARVSPEQKLKIIKGLQDKDQFVAMTGDGVNDAPALKNADIGVAMGINGTEVSKEAAHMILLDDNFTTIVKAVRSGRKIFDNILRFIKYVLTGNSGEIWTIFLAPFFGLPVPLLPIHILWVNLVTDGLPGLALASEPAETNIMNRPPRNPTKNIFAGGLAIHILWVGLLLGLLCIGTQAWAIKHDPENWQTMVFSVLCFSQMGHLLAIRSDDQSLFRQGLFSNKPLLGALLLTVVLQLLTIYVPVLNPIFRTKPLSLEELGLVLAVSSIVFFAVEIEKLFKRCARAKVALAVSTSEL